MNKKILKASLYFISIIMISLFSAAIVHAACPATPAQTLGINSGSSTRLAGLIVETKHNDVFFNDSITIAQDLGSAKYVRYIGTSGVSVDSSSVQTKTWNAGSTYYTTRDESCSKSGYLWLGYGLKDLGYGNAWGLDCVSDGGTEIVFSAKVNLATSGTGWWKYFYSGSKGDGVVTATHRAYTTRPADSTLSGTNNDDPVVKFKVENGYTSRLVFNFQTVPEYTLTYDANGGSGAPGSEKKYSGNTWTIPSTEPTHDGYKFLSWNSNSTGTGTNYYAADTLNLTQNLTLYANWGKVSVEHVSPAADASLDPGNVIFQAKATNVSTNTGWGVGVHVQYRKVGAEDWIDFDGNSNTCASGTSINTNGWKPNVTNNCFVNSGTAVSYPAVSITDPGNYEWKVQGIIKPFGSYVYSPVSASRRFTIKAPNTSPTTTLISPANNMVVNLAAGTSAVGVNLVAKADDAEANGVGIQAMYRKVGATNWLNFGQNIDNNTPVAGQSSEPLYTSTTRPSIYTCWGWQAANPDCSQAYSPTGTSHTFATLALTAGEYEWSARGRDNGTGNLYGTYAPIWKFRINTPPVSSIVSPANNSVINTSDNMGTNDPADDLAEVQLVGKATDADGNTVAIQTLIRRIENADGTASTDQKWRNFGTYSDAYQQPVTYGTTKGHNVVTEATSKPTDISTGGWRAYPAAGPSSTQNTNIALPKVWLLGGRYEYRVVEARDQYQAKDETDRIGYFYVNNRPVPLHNEPTNNQVFTAPITSTGGYGDYSVTFKGKSTDINKDQVRYRIAYAGPKSSTGTWPAWVYVPSSSTYTGLNAQNAVYEISTIPLGAGEYRWRIISQDEHGLGNLPPIDSTNAWDMDGDWYFTIKAPPKLSVSINPVNSGKVTGTGISCGDGTTNDCTEYHNTGATNTITAASTKADYTFTSWSGDCTGTSLGVTVTMGTTDKVCTANFGLPPVFSIPSPVNGASLTNPIDKNTTVNLKVTLTAQKTGEMLHYRIWYRKSTDANDSTGKPLWRTPVVCDYSSTWQTSPLTRTDCTTPELEDTATGEYWQWYAEGYGDKTKKDDGTFLTVFSPQYIFTLTRPEPYADLFINESKTPSTTNAEKARYRCQYSNATSVTIRQKPDTNLVTHSIVSPYAAGFVEGEIDLTFGANEYECVAKNYTKEYVSSVPLTRVGLNCDVIPSGGVIPLTVMAKALPKPNEGFFGSYNFNFDDGTILSNVGPTQYHVYKTTKLDQSPYILTISSTYDGLTVSCVAPVTPTDPTDGSGGETN